MASPGSKAQRLQVRVSGREKETLERAAFESKQTASEFIRTAALHQAEHVLADRRVFLLDPEKWEQFERALDRPPVLKPKLKDLLTSRSVLDADQVDFGKVERLDKSHDISGFVCGNPVLDQWLAKFAMMAQKSGSASVRVVTESGSKQVVGYYALSMASVGMDNVPTRAGAGMSDPVPAILLARFATHTDVQGLGLGKALMKDILYRCLAVADDVGCRALLIHAKSDDGRSWYGQWEFEPSPTNDLHLWMLIKDIRKARAGDGCGGHVASQSHEQV